MEFFKIIKKNELFKITLAISLLWYVAAVLIYFSEKIENDQMFTSIGDALWWSIVTIATVGYGDKYPITPMGRVMAGGVIISGVVLFSMLTATISSIFVERKMKQRQGLSPTKLKNHIIICGWNSHVEEILRIFTLYSHKNNNNFKIVLVNESQPEKMEALLETYSSLEIDFIRGNHTIETILNHANIKYASSVLVVPDVIAGKGNLSDERTLHSVLTIKSINPKVKIFVHLFDNENYSHLKRANADDIIVSDQHIGMMLANNIIFPGATQVTLNLLDYEKGNDIHRVEIPNEFIGKSFENLMLHFKRKENWTLIALIKNEEKMSLSDMISFEGSGIDKFIERKFRESGIKVEERSGIQLNINPKLDYEIKKDEFAIIIGTVQHRHKIL
ncbi:MAG: ion channel [Bacteroidota bacterium]